MKQNNGGAINEKTVYIKSQSNRKITVQFWVSERGYQTMYIYAVSIGEGIGSVSGANVNFNGFHYSESKIMNFSGTVPGFVCKTDFILRWYVDSVDGIDLEEPFWIGDTGPHVYYTVLAAPKSPMPEPWTGVLDYSCVWAEGQSSTSGAITALTTKLYANSGLYYDGYQSHYELDRYPNPTKCTFNLTKFLNEWNKADCQDCGMFLSILSSSIGASLTQTRRIEAYFTTKNLCAIGWASTRWEAMGWNFHHIGWLNFVHHQKKRKKQLMIILQKYIQFHFELQKFPLQVREVGCQVPKVKKVSL